MRPLSLAFPLFLAASLAAAQTTVPATRPAAIYSSNFAAGNVDHWSNPLIQKVPSGKRTFLGNFAAESNTLSLENLSEHARIRISFDVLVIMTWDGDAYLEKPTEIGPDSFNVTVDHGPRLLNVSFVNAPSSANVTQSFPGTFPYDHVPGGTTATEHNTLGFNGISNEDFTYHVTRTFGHAAKSIKIAFSGINLQDKSDEAWGLDNVKVELLPALPPQKHDPRAFDHLWLALGQENPATALNAISTLVDFGDDAVLEMRQHPEPAPATQADQGPLIHKLIIQLDDDSYQLREQASAALHDLGPAAEPVLRQARAEEHLSAEVQMRIDALLANIKNLPTETISDRRSRRLVEILELINTGESRKSLAALAAHSTGYTAFESKNAAARLAGQSPIPTKLDLPPNLPPRPTQ